MEIEVPQKTLAKILWNAGHRTTSSLGKRGKIPERTARRYIAEFKAGGTDKRKPYAPRKKTVSTTKLVGKVIRKAKDRAHIWSSRSIGVSENVSHTLVNSILHDHGLRFSSYKRKVKLNPERKAKRLRFANQMKNKDEDWKSTFFSDECSVWLSKCKPNKLWTTDPLNEEGGGVHGVKLHCWGAISSRGALDLEIFEKNLNAEGYIKILQKKLPKMRALYPRGWTWQQDGSGPHRANTVKEFINTNMPKNLEWPPYSPDLSPIENIWGWLKGEVGKDAPKTKFSLKRSILKHWRRIDKEFLEPYFQSMPHRLDLVIQNNGGHIQY